MTLLIKLLYTAAKKLTLHIEQTDLTIIQCLTGWYEDPRKKIARIGRKDV